MDNNFLLTYSQEDEEGYIVDSYTWYESEEKMLDGIKFKQQYYSSFVINEVIEILTSREIDVKE